MIDEDSKIHLLTKIIKKITNSYCKNDSLLILCYLHIFYNLAMKMKMNLLHLPTVYIHDKDQVILEYKKFKVSLMDLQIWFQESYWMLICDLP